MQGYGAPIIVYLAYVVKILLYVSVGVLRELHTRDGQPPTSGLVVAPEAFQKAILWTCCSAWGRAEVVRSPDATCRR
jgi:hypothetical protein